MSALKIELQGFDRVMKALKDLPEEKLANIEVIMETGVRDMAAEAKQRVPKDMGQLANSITVKKPSRFRFELIAQKHYAPYVNFGTGLYASQFLGSLDQEWSSYARQFYVNGKGRVRGNGFFTYPVEENKTKIIEAIKKALLK